MKKAAQLINEVADLSTFDVQVKNTTNGVSVAIKVEGQIIGSVYADRPYLANMHSKIGKETLSKLFEELGTDVIFNMVESELERDYRGSGLGSAMYVRLVQEIDKRHGWLTSALFNSTSDQAMRVWNSMSKYASTVKKVETTGGTVWCARGAKV